MPPAGQQADRPEPRADVEVLAAGLAELGVGDPQPLVGGRVGVHPLEQRARLAPGAASWASASPRTRARRPASSSRTRSSSPSESSRGPASDAQRRGRGSRRGQASRQALTSSRSRRAICSRSVRRAARSSTSGMTTGVRPGESCSISAMVRTPSMDLSAAYHRVRGSQAPRILPLRPMPRNDPTDTGGLFIGRRPGTAPLRYKADPSPGRRAPPPDRRDCSPPPCSRSRRWSA